MKVGVELSDTQSRICFTRNELTLVEIVFSKGEWAEMAHELKNVSKLIETAIENEYSKIYNNALNKEQ